MKKSPQTQPPLPPVDFSKGTLGQYSNLLAKGTNIAVIDPAVHDHCPDSESVNRALRALLTLRESLQAASPQPSGTNAS